MMQADAQAHVRHEHVAAAAVCTYTCLHQHVTAAAVCAYTCQHVRAAATCVSAYMCLQQHVATAAVCAYINTYTYHQRLIVPSCVTTSARIRSEYVHFHQPVVERFIRDKKAKKKKNYWEAMRQLHTN